MGYRVDKRKYYFDEEAAENAVYFIENHCHHTKGEWFGKPLALDEWQKEDIVRPIFGWKRKSDGLRKIRTAYIEIPRKNGKSAITSALGLVLLVVDGEGGAEIYCAAGDKNQADVIYDTSKNMVELDAELRQLCEPLQKSIYFAETMSAFKSITSKADTKHGFNAHGILVDELHIHPDRELLDTLENSTGARRQPLTVIITTAGIRKTGNVAWEMHNYAKKVRDGIIKDDSFWAVLYGVDEEELKTPDDIFKEAAWAAANPGYPVYPKKDYMATRALRAQEDPSYLNSFKRFHLNIWTSSEQAYIKGKDWAKCNFGAIDEEKLKGQPVVMGMDLASTGDFCSVAMVYKNEETQKYDCLVRSWIPEFNIDQRKNANQIREWIKKGWVVATPGNVTDYNFIQAFVEECLDKYDVKEINYDSWNTTQLAANLEAAEAPLVIFRQGYKSFAPVVNELWRLVKKKEINHAGNPVLGWMIDNVTTTQDPAGNLKPDKQKSADKIDGVVALMMALSGAVFRNVLQETGGSIYDNPDLDAEDLVL